MQIPKDPVMLLSFINMKLRDEFNSLEEMALSLNLDMNEITEKLANINYFYDEEANQFK